MKLTLAMALIFLFLFSGCEEKNYAVGFNDGYARMKKHLTSEYEKGRTDGSAEAYKEFGPRTEPKL